ncbi:hypothetical protein [Nocardia sp. NPDC005978]|uniref:hypothetical protein n=1 Tax=unclassified Nocardia TaxID=2637762 RepID=UPI0033BEAC00
MKKLVVTAGLIVGCAAGSFAPAAAAPAVDPWDPLAACKITGLTDSDCSGQTLAEDPATATSPMAGFGYSGSAARTN